MRNLFSQKKNNLPTQSGFTLMEIVVSTAIFASTVTLMLGLFNSALKINRRVESLRQVAQGTRNFTETLTREIRNGRVDYSGAGFCNSFNYGSSNNQGLAIVNHAGEKLCFYLDTTTSELMVSKSVNGSTVTESINPQNFRINTSTFEFVVRPTDNPDTGSAPYIGIQPQVTIFAQFQVQLSTNELITLPYQTTISTDVYDIPHFQ